MSKFNIMNRAEKIVDYVLTITEKSPKKLRLDIVPEMRKKALDIVEDVVRANFLAVTGEGATPETRSERLAFQEHCLATIRVLEAFAEIANSHSYITEDQLCYLTKLTQELFDMIKKWQEGDKARSK